MPRDQLLRWAGASITVLWLSWIFIWLVAALRAKPAAQRQSLGSRALDRVLILAAVILLLLGRTTRPGRVFLAAAPAAAWLYGRFVRPYPGVVLLGAPLVLIGLGIAVWARFYLGNNWSGSVTFKQDHELILSGPYRYVRHPIYSGLLLAFAGSACAIGQWRGVVGFVLIFLAFWYRTRLEERLMIEHFGDAYRHYRAQVKRLIPFLF
ncbi:MAG TPA: isoprenylcysteine carboxylmethyltransferase family protein [Steroidobacteraceae bacterium]|nr:isoprenylcysteine carboxylmethyltransferase family protein [Steroidobacteraceae bacterium]